MTLIKTLLFNQCNLHTSMDMSLFIQNTRQHCCKFAIYITRQHYCKFAIYIMLCSYQIDDIECSIVATSRTCYCLSLYRILFSFSHPFSALFFNKAGLQDGMGAHLPLCIPRSRMGGVCTPLLLRGCRCHPH